MTNYCVPYKALRVVFGLTAILWMSSCTVTLPEPNLNDQDWQIWTGQALWQPPKNKPKVAGDVLLARHASGDVYLNLAKPPVNIFSAQTHKASWQLDTIYTKKTYKGRGKAPRRFIWFYLPDVLSGKGALPKPWQLERIDASTWLFKNTSNLETIRLVIDEV